MGILDNVSPLEKLRFRMESQTGLQNLQIDEAEFARQEAKETASGKSSFSTGTSDRLTWET